MLSFILNISCVQAESSLFLKVTNLLRKVVGRKDRAIKVTMPTLPTINKDSTSIESAEDYKDPNERRFSLKDKNRYDYYFIQEVYKATRHTKPNANEISQWMNVIGQGGSREGVYRAIVLGQDYRAMEGYASVRLKAKSVQFVEWYLSKFLHKTIKHRSLVSSNMYTVKRIVVEMSLELIDAFLIQKKEQDLFAWYGILSADLALKYPEAFKSKQRLKIDAQGHMEWAKRVPVQFLKSEVIIKLHKVINYLNRH
jgi:hypothetical protein